MFSATGRVIEAAVARPGDQPAEESVGDGATMDWDGRTDHGSRAKAGVYLCRMTAGAFVAERRLSLPP